MPHLSPLYRFLTVLYAVFGFGRIFLRFCGFGYTPMPPSITAMFTLYRIAFASPRKQYLIGLMFTNKNGCGGAISVTERSYAASIFKVESHISDRCSHYTGWLFGAAWNAIRGYRVNLVLPWWLGDKVEQSFLINKGQILMARLEPRLKDLKFDILKLMLGDASVLRGTPLKFMYLNIWM